METKNTNDVELIKGSIEWLKERDSILADWEQAKTILETAKADEMMLRKKFVDFSFDHTKTSGTERIELANGYEAKAVKKETYHLVSYKEGLPVADAVDEILAAIEKADKEAGKFIANRLVKWTPELVVSEYKKVSEEYPKIKTIIDKVIETRQGAPTLEIVPPKGTKI